MQLHSLRPRSRTTGPCILFLLALTGLLVMPALAGDNNATDNTYCQNRYNLDFSTRNNISVPTIVDIDIATGNLLVRGQVPLNLRDAPDNAHGCRMHDDWYYAYDGMNALMQDKRSFVPAYFTSDNYRNDAKAAAIRRAMADFSLDQYEVIDISLLTHQGNDIQEFGPISQAFGNGYSLCTGPLKNSPFHGRNGSAVWSDVHFCPPGLAIDAACTQSMTEDGVSADSCAYASRIGQIIALLAGEGQAPGTKRLIYYHCSQGSDRTGAITMSYLQKTIPSMSFVDARHYAEYLGREGNDGSRWPVSNGCDTAALAYCEHIGGSCGQKTEATRILLPGSDTHTHVPGQEDPVVTPAPTAVPVPAQTMVPMAPYRPDPTAVIF